MGEDDVKIIKSEQGYLLEITVPRADLSKRPIYLKGTPQGNTYVRHAEGDYKCKNDEIRRMYAEANLSECPLDSRILEGYTIEDDIDRQSFEEYRKLFSTQHPTHPWAPLSDIEFLRKFGGYRKDRRTGEEGLTLAGILMFGKLSSITDVDCCPQYFPDYREYNGSGENERWSDRVYCDGTWEANLFQFYRRVYNKLAASLPKPFALKDGTRIEDSPMHIALREAFVNCLIHCDYTIDANIIVESYRNKYVFTNPGSLLIPLSQYYSGGESKCRNKSLQKMFMLIGKAEKAGSGADKIIKGWKSSNYRNPDIEEKTNKVVLTMPLESILSEGVLSTLKGIYGEEVVSIENEKLLVLAACASDGYTSNYRIQLVLEKHPSDIRQLLKTMCQEGYLISSGIGKGTTYSLNKYYLSQKGFGAHAEVSSTTGEVVSYSNTEPAIHISNMGSSLQNMDSSAQNVDSSSSKVGSSDPRTKIKRGKANPAQLQRMILDVCQDDYKTIEEIAQRVGRGIKYLKNSFISKMVGDGLLDRKYPEIPTHPDQRYKAHHFNNENVEPTLF